MQNIIDDNYLDQLDVTKNGEYREYIGERVLGLLNMRVANRISELLEDNQLNEFTSQPDDQKMNWLKSNVTSFDSIVNEELSGIIADMKAVMPS